MKSCETKESMKYEMRPVTLAMASAAAGAAFTWAGIVTSLTIRGTNWRPPFSFRRRYRAWSHRPYFQPLPLQG